jgi:peroxiredoxin
MSTHLTTQELDAGPDGAQHLPVTATFLIDGKGVIRLAHVDVDYMRRLDPDDVIAALTKLFWFPRPTWFFR